MNHCVTDNMSRTVIVPWDKLRETVDGAYKGHHQMLCQLLDDVRYWQDKHPDETPSVLTAQRIEEAARRFSVAVEVADALERSEGQSRLVIHGWQGRNIDSEPAQQS